VLPGVDDLDDGAGEIGHPACLHGCPVAGEPYLLDRSTA
jgi:hypothetical protein